MSRAVADNINCSLAQEHPISKQWAEHIPPINDNFSVSRETIFKFLTQNLEPEAEDIFDRTQKRLTEPKSMREFFDISKEVTEEERYNNAITLLKQWNAKYNGKQETMYSNMKEVVGTKLAIDFKKQEAYLQELERVMEKIYSDVKQKPIYKRIRKNLEEATKKWIKIRSSGLTEENVKIFHDSLDDIKNCIDDDVMPKIMETDRKSVV